jgi:hypothetical protein
MRSRPIAAVVVGFAVVTAIVGCEIEVPLDDGRFPDASIPPPDAAVSLPHDAPGSGGSQDGGTGSGNGGDGGVIPPPDAAI